ncbi:acyl-[acyl-carrier-protein]-UDP-N-acetylglucosamineO-acyltransferase [Tannerella forsythia KS16]|jgi:acyl-[acyl-carrier-protein]-UDP-N-acetylglucosamine O-acyltransferase|uniref:Acyl-[acyl-carrier-protein]-UDP-N-acetylglucosamine O-acyltransferase n=2 Tax=Tannerella forsythia TaxID=28112 RepID=G8UKA8_TANFA|nr:acyl-ACP--UDP-N-acetylglucosamine O-acyltransferase [Tannerella forsythia]AEW21265.1 acyl-[acyl-carrier-protein]-UDP-N-acetylglucosamine O-acyltransferase [Tannerella forsythia 92A2]KKY60986.1 UDP-N-acetylglucosamine acyltransferase [Tannerella forsythia]OLQ20115.1 acyl-[acyl-carrier-protein]--UDP-N-acetylglucosamine O-acyltransferase [Tannerella forsythia]PDP42585.1 acyl-ACP--UDP-N-acetylglucosamine O-acyltransferase [Tannerella forsythia]PDP71782.1 acyl-ACP--UDP-N-acetylglucosamine O-acyl
MHSPLAVVHPEAQIGKNVTVEPFAFIEKDVVIGDNCRIYPHAVVLEGSRIGKGCHIFPGAVISGIPQDLKFAGEKTTAEIGDHTTVRECVTVNRGTASRGKTIVGNNCLLMAYSHIAHDCILKNNIIIGNASQIAGEVEIDDFAILSGSVLVHQFTRISQHVMIQGGSRVGKDIPPYTLIGRDPIAYCGINIVGLRRRGFTNQQVFLIQDIYRTLYTRGLNNTDALLAIETEYEASKERDLILNFIKSSKRGIVRGSIDE